MVILFLFFGYQKWFEYEAQTLVPNISNGPLIFWLYPVFGIRGASWFLGVSEWIFCGLLFLGFWNKKLGILGALGSVASFIGTVTIIPFMPERDSALYREFRNMIWLCNGENVCCVTIASANRLTCANPLAPHHQYGHFDSSFQFSIDLRCHLLIRGKRVQ